MTGPQTCPNCGTVSQPNARFCSQCSQPLLKTCSKCSNTMPIMAQFCNQCGTPFASAGPTAPGQPARQPGPPPVGQTGRLGAAALVAGRYEVVRKLGQGGMGAVYLVHDRRLGSKTCALKEMSDQGILDPAEREAALAAFEQEAHILAGLDHANLPKVTDYFAESGNQYLVMEYVQGETLEKRLERAAGPLPEPLVRKYADQLCDVLAYLHSRQPPIIFRDLKPANIMVQADDKVKLIDFGIARHFKPGKSRDTQSMGTPGYAAPEQYGKGQSDARTDIYALGATMHHMLTGCDPSADPFKFASARGLNPVLSRSIDQVVMQAVELDPGRRWQSVRDLRSLLAKATGPTSFVSTSPAPVPVPRMATQAALPPAPLPQTALARPPQPAAPVPGFSSLPVPGQPLRVPVPQNVPQPIMVPNPFMQAQPPGLLGKQFAGYGQRVIAYVIDMFLIMVLYVVLAAITGALFASGSSLGTGLGGISLGLLFISAWAYLIWPTAKSGQTLGKKAMGIAVIDDSGAAPGWGKSFLRYLIGFTIESMFFYIGWLWPLFDAKKQAWHDKIASTYVVQK